MKKEDKKRCEICEIPYFERNNYFYGKLMTVRDFFDEQCYFNEKRWLINRAVHGWGVVCGLDVKRKLIDPEDPNKGYDKKRVVVTPGLAIDCSGREILVCEERTVSLKPEVSECHTTQSEQQQEEQPLAICLEYLDCKTEAIHLPPIACDQKEKCEFNRIRDSFKISVVPIQELQETPFCPKTIKEREKSLHQYLCDRLRPYDDCPKCPDSHCVILATVKVNNADNIINGSLDICTHRKLIYSNPLLYDLINCFHGDLPHITEINWEGLHTEVVKWDKFEALVNDGLIVTFDKVMDEATINRHTFLFVAITVEEPTGYRRLKYIPSSDIKIVIDKEKEETKATFAVEDGEGWRGDEVTGKHSEISSGADFEIILRGGSILSKEGKALDGAFIGRELPSGNGFQGSDFVSWFSVKPKGGE